MNSEVKEIIQSFSLDDYRPIEPRELDLGDPLPPKVGNLVTVVTGMRRSGKTYRLFQEMERLQNMGVPTWRILYFNFEDNRFGEVTPATGDAVLDAFHSLHPQAFDTGAYLFLDELQEMKDWGMWLRRVVDCIRADALQFPGICRAS